MVPGAGLEPARSFKATDFESAVSANSTTRAGWSRQAVWSLLAQRSLYDMSSGAGSRLLRLLVLLVAVGILREASIRRHTKDLNDWPRRPQPA